LEPATCQINSQTFNFGRHQGPYESPVHGNATISVTCTRAPLAEGTDVTVSYDLKAIPALPGRQMRNDLGADAGDWSYLGFDMFVDPARTRFWGDGELTGTFAFTGTLFLDDRNRVGSLGHVVYGHVPTAHHPVQPGNWLGLVGLKLDYTATCTGGAGGGPGRRVGGVGIRGGR
jgi:spore coat protein U-like protein